MNGPKVKGSPPYGFNTVNQTSVQLIIVKKMSLSLPGVSNLLVSLSHTGRRRVVLGHTLNTLWHVIAKISMF